MTKRGTGRIDEFVVDGHGNLRKIKGNIQQVTLREEEAANGINDARLLTAAPKPNGKIMPAALMDRDARAFFLTTDMST